MTLDRLNFIIDRITRNRSAPDIDVLALEACEALKPYLTPPQATEPEADEATTGRISIPGPIEVGPDVLLDGTGGRLKITSKPKAHGEKAK